MVFKVFFVISFLPCVPFYQLVSLPPRVMLHNCSIAPRDSATDIEKNPEKVPEREQPKRSVVKGPNLNSSHWDLKYVDATI